MILSTERHNQCKNANLTKCKPNFFCKENWSRKRTRMRKFSRTIWQIATDLQGNTDG
jgi:hypothetical protein